MVLKCYYSLGSRLVVGQQILALPTGVRIPAPQFDCFMGHGRYGYALLF